MGIQRHKNNFKESKDKEASGYWKFQHGILKLRHFNLDRVIEMALKKTDPHNLLHQLHEKIKCLLGSLDFRTI